MLLIIAIVLGILWLTGKLVIHIATPLVHLLLVIAAIIIIYNFISGRRSS